MQEQRDSGYPKAACVVFCLVLGGLSNLFAEVIGGSCQLAMLSPGGLILTYPLYTLQLITLGGVALRRGSHSLRSLYLMGVVFGLYEAYITKVLWSPPWNAHAFRLGGVAVVETLMLALFWHPIMAFVVPTLVAEKLLAGRQTLYLQLAPRLRSYLESQRAPVWIGLVLGLNNGFMSKPPHLALGSVIGTLAIIGLLVRIFRTITPQPDRDIGYLLPQARAVRVLAVMVLLQYAVLAKWLRPEALPGIRAQATIWAVYGVAIWSLWISALHTRRYGAPKSVGGEALHLSAPGLRRGMVTFAVTSLAVCWLPPTCYLVYFLLVWAIATPLGCVIFFRVMRSLSTRGQQEPSSP